MSQVSRPALPSDRVLAVEPFRDQQPLIEKALQRDHIQVLPASSVLEGVLQQATEPAPVVIYDMDSGENWREALKQFLRVRPTSRLVFLSRDADTRKWLEVLDAGGYEVVRKPLEPRKLRSVVRKALRQGGRAPELE